MVIICCCYIVIGLAAPFAYAVSSANLRGLKRELFDYFECERVPDIVGSDQLQCDRSGYESFLNPTTKILGYNLVALFPVVNLIYFFSKKKVTHMKRKISSASRSLSSRSFTLTGIQNQNNV